MWLFFTIVFTIILIILCFVDVHAFLSCFYVYPMLKKNLDYLAKVIEKYDIILISIIIVSFIVYYITHFTINITEFSFAGLTFSFRKTEDVIKTKIRNHLNTKRSLFFFLEDYDNIYDVINTWYDTLLYVHGLLTAVENGKALSKECDDELQEFILDLNLFLTKYQSNYRRWYEIEIKKDFKPFAELQKEYYRYSEIVADIGILNQQMRQHGDYFGVTYNKWASLVEKIQNQA